MSRKEGVNEYNNAEAFNRHFWKASEEFQIYLKMKYGDWYDVMLTSAEYQIICGIRKIGMELLK